jgi:hypothetical protein
MKSRLATLTTSLNPPSAPATEDLDLTIEQCKKEFKELVKKCKEKKTKFSDPEFDVINNPDKCLYIDPRNKKNFTDCKGIKKWKRITEICTKPKLFIDNADPGDIMQGQLSTCYLLGAMSVIACRKNFFESLFLDYSVELGIYALRFFIDGDWYYVIIDDYFPVDAKDKPVFAWAKDPNEVWVAVLEKAYAKLHDSFEGISLGEERRALADLTGGIESVFYLPRLTDKQGLWDELNDNCNTYLYCCSIPSAQVENKLPNGLLTGHAYGILGLYDEEGIRLIKIRNPYGDSEEWNGRWSDNDIKWQEYPGLKKKLKHVAAHDGTFYMSFEDFLVNFTQVDRCILFNGKWKLTKVYAKYTNGRKIAFTIKTKKPTPAHIALSQKNQRHAHGRDVYELTIGFNFYKTSKPNSPLDESAYTLMAVEKPAVERCICTEQNLEADTTYVFIPMCGKTSKRKVKLCFRVYSYLQDVIVTDLDDQLVQTDQYNNDPPPPKEEKTRMVRNKTSTGFKEKMEQASQLRHSALPTSTSTNDVSPSTTPREPDEEDGNEGTFKAIKMKKNTRRRTVNKDNK